ncbi:hypothetical protein MLD38_021382 [Melastoma candidum]|nr:hypothetical protein MLD38_021382 [Melastoma candidum]
MNSNKKVLASLWLIAFLTPAYAASKHVVVIQNDIQGQDLGVHCKSADDDLGFVPLHQGQQWGFYFHTRFIGTTHFYCNLFTMDSSHALTVYDNNVHRYVGDTCHWSIQSNRSCLFKSDIQLSGCHD